VSDSKNNPKIPPPDDFSKTTPNINLPDAKDYDDSPSDWEKSQIGLPPEAPADDWGKTVINYDSSSSKSESEEDFSNTHYSNNSPKEPEWGMTQANFSINNDFEPTDKNDFGSSADNNDFGKSEEENFGATVPYFKLPEVERAKYQDLPPTPTERVKTEAEEKKQTGGIPIWFWVSAGLMTMFAFALIVLVGGYFLFFPNSGFTFVVKGAQPNSQVLVDKQVWGVSNAKGEIVLTGIRAGERNVIIRKQGYEDDNRNFRGDNADVVPIVAIQKKSAPPMDDCKEIKSGEIAKAEKCANQGLDNLANPPDLDDLLKALNLYYINFDSGKDNIPAERMKFLERASTYIKQLPSSVVIEVGGHTDSDGTDESNQPLSERRAKSVKAALVKFGVNEAMLTTKGYGESKPRPGNTNSTDDEKFQNRRIEYTAVKR
jgi:outer membrane protein OmpA-like peptidoglycan-associated protein